MKRLLDLYHRHPVISWLFVLGCISQLLTGSNVLPDPSRYDTGVHFLFSIIVAQVAVAVIREFGQIKDEKGRSSPFTAFGIILLAFMGGITIGCLWEIVEFSLDHLAGAHLQKGNVDTMTDLIADVCGSFIGGLIAAYNRKLLHKMRVE